ncbi:Cytoplasmic protein nck2 [Porites harrisoni]
MEGYLDFKESSKWVTYWVVIRGSQLVFFANADTHITENAKGHIDLGPKSSFVDGKRKAKDKFEFEVKAERGKKYLFRTTTDRSRLQWVHTLHLAAQGKPPPPLIVGNLDCGESKTSPTSRSPTENQYTEVPEFNIPVIGVTEEEMAKSLLKKHNSFSSHCKKLLGRKKSDGLSKSFNAADLSREPVMEGAEAAKEEAFYDIVPGNKPPWYFGKISRVEAESILESCQPGRFLVRDSETVNKPGAYTLSLKHHDRCRHHKIETLYPEGNLVIKGHEDKTFPNLATLMKYFAKSQEKEIHLTPVVCQEPEDQATASPSTSSHPDPEASYEIIVDQVDSRPPVPGCEGKPLAESNENLPPRKLPHGYENVPDKPRAKPPLLSRNTEPVLPMRGYENLPPKVGNRSPVVREPDSYETMESRETRDSFEEAPKPSLPPRKPAKTPHGYENLPEKPAVPLPPRGPAPDGYVNLPGKEKRSLSEPPQLPPRAQRQSHLGYENLPSGGRGAHRPAPVPYQNIPPQGYNHSQGQQPRRPPAPPMTRAATLPAHIIENTLGKMDLKENPF